MPWPSPCLYSPHHRQRSAFNGDPLYLSLSHSTAQNSRSLHAETPQIFHFQQWDTSQNPISLQQEAQIRHPVLNGRIVRPVTQALRPAYEELACALPSQQHLGIDESPTKEAATKAWLWTFVAGLFTVFAVRGTRAATVSERLRLRHSSRPSPLRPAAHAFIAP